MHFDTELLALICGHILGDFALQSDTLATNKARRKAPMVGHLLTVTVVTWLLLGNIALWWLALLVLGTHGAIDLGKIIWEKKSSGTTKLDNLFIDQGLHLLTLVALWYFTRSLMPTPPVNQWEQWLGPDFRKGLLMLCGLGVTVPAIGVVLKFQMAEFAAMLGTSHQHGLPRGGKTIGMLERFLVFMFVLAGKPEGVGFVIAAKSVFRIGELTNKAERDHAEYIMIGTLRSFAYALATAFITSWLMGRI